MNMKIKNSPTQFGTVAILLHWIMAILLIGLLILGLYMTSLPIGKLKIKLYGWHKEFGMLVLMLVMLRFGWRITNINPSLANLPWWERMGAKSVHWAFYVLMFAMPISGWLVTSAAGFPVSFFGWFVIPNLIGPSEEMRSFFSEIHEWLAYGLIAIIFLHTGAALKHHFIDKDDILRRMF